VGLARCGTVFPVSVVVGARVNPSVCLCEGGGGGWGGVRVGVEGLAAHHTSPGPPRFGMRFREKGGQY